MRQLKYIFNKYNHFVVLMVAIIISFLSIKYFQHYKEKEISNFEKLFNNIYLEKTSKAFLDNLSPRYETYSYYVKTGDNFNKILENIDIPQSEKKNS